jgi:hypothetical protein
MSVRQSAVDEAFRDMGAVEDRAPKAAAVPGKREDDLTAAVTSLKLDIASVKADRVLTEWMVGFLPAFNVTIIFKLFSH